MEDEPKVILLSNDADDSEESGQAYVELPQLSDRCGGSRDDSLIVAVPEGVTLPDRVRVIKREVR